MILHDGDSCPVCNGIYQEAQLKPLPTMSLVDTTSLQNQKAVAQKAAQDAKTKAEATLEIVQKKELECHQDLAEVEANLMQLQQEISAVLQADNWLYRKNNCKLPGRLH